MSKKIGVQKKPAFRGVWIPGAGVLQPFSE